MTEGEEIDLKRILGTYQFIKLTLLFGISVFNSVYDYHLC